MCETNCGGVAIDGAAKAHLADPAGAGRSRRQLPQVLGRCAGGTVFCLAGPPSPDAAAEVHRQAHGLAADHIYQVQEDS
jgi:hypothetical protein